MKKHNIKALIAKLSLSILLITALISIVLYFSSDFEYDPIFLFGFYFIVLPVFAVLILRSIMNDIAFFITENKLFKEETESYKYKRIMKGRNKKVKFTSQILILIAVVYVLISCTVICYPMLFENSIKSSLNISTDFSCKNITENALPAEENTDSKGTEKILEIGKTFVYEWNDTISTNTTVPENSEYQGIYSVVNVFSNCPSAFVNKFYDSYLRRADSTYISLSKHLNRVTGEYDALNREKKTFEWNGYSGVYMTFINPKEGIYILMKKDNTLIKINIVSSDNTDAFALNYDEIKQSLTNLIDWLEKN